jgi:hypothetical protein
MFGKLNGVIDAAFHATAHFEHFAGDYLRQGAGELRQLRRLQYLGARFDIDLAVLLRHERRELVDVPLEQRLVPVEDLDPLLDRRSRPRRERSSCRLHRVVHLARRRKRDAGKNPTAAGIVDVEPGDIGRYEDASDAVLHFGIFHLPTCPGRRRLARRPPVRLSSRSAL